MTLIEREAPVRSTGDGGFPARRAIVRWAWRLLRREWPQQLLILALITVAVAATVVGSAVATNTPPAAGAGFGSATDIATFASPGSAEAAQIVALARQFGSVDVIENQTISVPGSVITYSLRAQDPRWRVRRADAVAGGRTVPERGGGGGVDRRGRIQSCT